MIARAAFLLLALAPGIVRAEGEPKLTPGHWLPLQLASRGAGDPMRQSAIQGALLGLMAVYQSAPGLSAPVGVVVAPRLLSGVPGAMPRADQPAAGELQLVLNAFYVPCGCPNEVVWDMPQMEVRIAVNWIEAAAGNRPARDGVSGDVGEGEPPRIRALRPFVFVNDASPDVQVILTKIDRPLFITSASAPSTVEVNPGFFDPSRRPGDPQLLVVFHPTRADSLPPSVNDAFREIDLDRLLDLLPD